LRVRGRRDAAGFTLVELMVALTGGLFLSVVVFALARDATRFYQREGRIASATLAGAVAFDRLKADIERAGYLSTPNIQSDPQNCTIVGAGAPAGLQALASARIFPDIPSLTSQAAFAANQAAGQVIQPDSIVLSGSYAATDEYTVADATDGMTITLQTNNPAMARLGYLNTSVTSEQTALLQGVFGSTAGQILRYKDRKGMVYFGQIASVSGGATPSVTLTTPLPLMRGATNTCGIDGRGTGDSVNVVNIVRYQVMDLQANTTLSPPWAPLFAASKGATAPVGENNRTELVRSMENAAGNTIAGTVDLVGEYAVDLEFSVMGQLVANTPTLTLATPPSAAFTTFYAAASLGDRPQGVRLIRTRLSVRSREADRTSGIAGGLYRFKLSGTTNDWARVRTFQADVALPNQRNVQW
jgi:Tfp pilus assembly protein PilW